MVVNKTNRNAAEAAFQKADAEACKEVMRANAAINRFQHISFVSMLSGAALIAVRVAATSVVCSLIECTKDDYSWNLPIVVGFTLFSAGTIGVAFAAKKRALLVQQVDQRIAFLRRQ